MCVRDGNNEGPVTGWRPLARGIYMVATKYKIGLFCPLLKSLVLVSVKCQLNIEAG